MVSRILFFFLFIASFFSCISPIVVEEIKLNNQKILEESQEIKKENIELSTENVELKDKILLISNDSDKLTADLSEKTKSYRILQSQLDDLNDSYDLLFCFISI